MSKFTIDKSRTALSTRPGFKLNKISALLAASAMLSLPSMQAAAQVLTSSQALAAAPVGTTIDGALGAGYLITGDDRFTGAPNVTIGSTQNKTLVHNFNTVGGAGSGGGAGLGGAFFVDTGATLTLINTDVKSNRVQGGPGGSEPALRFYDQSLNVIGQNTTLPSIRVNPDLPSIDYDKTNDRYSYNLLSINADTAAALKKNSLVIFENGAGLVTQITDVSTDNVRFKDNVVVDAKAVVRLVGDQVVTQPTFIDPVADLRIDANRTTSIYDLKGSTVQLGYQVIDRVTERVNSAPSIVLRDEKSLTYEKALESLSKLTIGSKVVVKKDAATNSEIATVKEISFYTKNDVTELGLAALRATDTPLSSDKVIADKQIADAGERALKELSGRIKSFTLDKPLSATEISTLDILSAPSLDAAQFNTSNGGKTVTVTNTLGTFTKGMAVSWVEGDRFVEKPTVRTAIVTDVSKDGRTLTLDTPLGERVTEFKAVENPLEGANAIKVVNAASKFSVGQLVFVPNQAGEVFEGRVQSVVGDVVTIAPLKGGQLSDYYDPTTGLSVKLSAGSVAGSGNAITVPFNTAKRTGETDAQRDARINKMLLNRTIEGASFDTGTLVSGVTVNADNTVTLALNKVISATSLVEYFKVYSPLSAGGNMNNLVRASDGTNGSKGISANFLSTFFNEGEGVDGTNGKAATNPVKGRGANGGDGGSGSSGQPVNVWVMYDLAAALGGLRTATWDLTLAGLELAEAMAPDPVPPALVAVSDPANVAKATMGLNKSKVDLTFALADLAIAVTNVTNWGVQLSKGLAGLGGAGGDGGAASGGADFFGGGQGGAGGNGGDGAISISDGGNGGSGGSGGSGGFGAGGGQGGAGGKAGANGNAEGGDPGSGGTPGFGAGAGADGDGLYGGGGSGFGGALFVREGGKLVIQGDALFELNYAAGGTTTSQFGQAGTSAGTDLFMMKGSNVRLEPGQGKVIRFEGSIADDSAATDGGFMNAAGDGADITIAGNGGKVVFNGANTYSGHTILEGASLEATMGTGINDASLVRFNGSGTISIVDGQVNPDNPNKLSLASTGTLLLKEDYVRRAGTDPSETSWTGSGGFATELTGGATVNLGKLDDNGRGQQLVWGQDGFFVPPPGANGSGLSGVLTFGSELSKGAVRFTNNVNLNQEVGRVAVYNTGSAESSQATLSGNWTNGTLIAGDSTTAYTGTLFMTGQSELNNMVVAGGLVSTYNKLPDGTAGTAGKLFASDAKLAVLEGSRLHLLGAESLNSVSLNPGANLVLTEKLSASDAFVNSGQVAILGGQYQALLNSATPELQAQIDKTALGLGYLPEGFNSWNGEVQVGGLFFNNAGAVVAQAGNVTVDEVTNLGVWAAQGDITVDKYLVNAGTMVMTGNLSATTGDVTNTATGSLQMTGNLSATAGNVQNAGSWTQTGALSVGQDLTNVTADANMTVTGNVTVARDLSNEGTMRITGDTAAGNITNKGSASFTGNVVAAGNIDNQLGATLVQAGNMTAANTVTNNAYWVMAQNGTIKSNQLAGAGTFCLAATDSTTCEGGTATTLTLDLASDSTFTGVLAGAGSLVKTGNASLELTAPQTFSGGLQINGGTLKASNTLNDKLDITVGAAGSYIVAADDLVRRVINNATGSHAVVLGKNLATTAGFENNGRLVVQGSRELYVNQAGLTGAATGDIKIDPNATLTLVQSGNSTYSGTMTRTDATSALVKAGVGTLTVDNTIDLRNVQISAGELALAKANILSADAAVVVGSAGKLSLVVGDQSINKLLGEGKVNLGANKLFVENGGEFKGEIAGTGAVVVDKGVFNITGTITSPAGSTADFTVNPGSTTNVSSTGKLLNVDQLQVQSGATLNLGTSGVGGGTVEATSVNIQGTLAGSGSVKGLTTIMSGGALKPGFSPGTLSFADGLVVQGNSTTSMEIKNLTEAAGTGFDQISIGGPFIIGSGAKLEIKDFGGNAWNLGLGKTVNLFKFNPDQVKGVFGEVTTDLGGKGVGALNLATGNVVGFGNTTLAQVAETATTTNQKALYNATLQSTGDGVAQFYGGRFIEKLTQAMDAGTGTKAVYNAYNPESYLALSEASQLAAQEALPSWKSRYRNQERFFAFANAATAANKLDQDHQAFGIDSRSLTVGVSRKLGGNTLLLTFGGVNSSVRGNQVQSSGSGFSAGAALVGDLGKMDASWFVGMSYADVDMEGQRQNLTGGTRFNAVNANSTRFELGLEKKYSFSAAYAMLRGALAVGSNQRARFNEIGSGSSLDAMTVHGSKQNYQLVDMGVELGRNINASTNWYSSFNYQFGNDDKRKVTASFDNEQARFSVDAKSALAATTKLMTGLRHRLSSDTSIEGSVGVARGWNSKTNLQSYVGLNKSF